MHRHGFGDDRVYYLPYATHTVSLQHQSPIDGMKKQLIHRLFIFCSFSCDAVRVPFIYLPFTPVVLHEV
jgi:hypothetical protein